MSLDVAQFNWTELLDIAVPVRSLGTLGAVLSGYGVGVPVGFGVAVGTLVGMAVGIAVGFVIGVGTIVGFAIGLAKLLVFSYGGFDPVARVVSRRCYFGMTTMFKR